MPNEVMKSLTIGANTYDLPQKTSDLTNDSGFLTSYTETDPTVPSWAKASSKPTYTASEVGAAASSHTHGNITNSGDITTNATIANGDRLVINDESASKITNSSITFGTDTSKYLANNGTWQSVPTVPTNISAFTNDSGYTTFSGSYNDLTNKPTIHTYSAGNDIDITNDTIGFDGYDVTTTTTTLCNETVTITNDWAELNYSTRIAADLIKITFNGIEYIYPGLEDNGDYYYGAVKLDYIVDFSEYPFGLVSTGSQNILFTKDAGTYTVKIEAITDNITVSSDFAKARGYSIVENPSQVLVNESVTTVSSDSTFNEGTLSYFSESNDAIKVTFNNVEYICPKDNNSYGAYYEHSSGTFNFSTYPFNLQPDSSGDNNLTHVITQTAGTYTVKIESCPTAAILTDDFKQAVKSSFPGNIMIQGVDYVTAGQASGSTLGSCATAEGYGTTASGEASHAEGSNTTASGYASHVEGIYTTASSSYSHAEGYMTTASDGNAAHAEGGRTTASGYYSHAEGYYTTANHKAQHVFGEYNVLDTSTASAQSRGNYVEIVGKGTSTSARSNARTLDWNGNEVLAGKLTVGTAPTANMDVTTKQYVDNATSSHTHGNITNGGDITTNVTIASGDRLVINDESASKITNSSITFGTSTTQYLANNGTWQSVPTAPVTSVNGNVGAVTGLQTTSNLVTSVSSSSTNSQYPSAKLFYDTVGNIEALLAAI